MKPILFVYFYICLLTLFVVFFNHTIEGHIESKKAKQYFMLFNNEM